jgi:hypothetical protein
MTAAVAVLCAAAALATLATLVATPGSSADDHKFDGTSEISPLAR